MNYLNERIIIEFEEVMDKLIETQINIKEYVKGYVLDIFNAADVKIKIFFFKNFYIIYSLIIMNILIIWSLISYIRI